MYYNPSVKCWVWKQPMYPHFSKYTKEACSLSVLQKKCCRTFIFRNRNYILIICSNLIRSPKGFVFFLSLVSFSWQTIIHSTQNTWWTAQTIFILDARESVFKVIFSFPLIALMLIETLKARHTTLLNFWQNTTKISSISPSILKIDSFCFHYFAVLTAHY